jgi:hypothetical protein
VTGYTALHFIISHQEIGMMVHFFGDGSHHIYKFDGFGIAVELKSPCKLAIFQVPMQRKGY